MKTIFNFFLLFSCLGLGQLQAQDIESLGGSPFTVSGNISVGSSFYKAINRDNRRSPFAYFISANPTFSIYGFDIPVSIAYRDQQGSISSSFNRYSISPRYKWAQLHLGNTSLTMNPYTLSGQLIKGAGLELTPGHVRIAVVAGKLENPLAQLDTIVEGAEILDIVFGTSLGISPVKWVQLKVNVAASAHTANQETISAFETEDFTQLKEDFGEVITLKLYRSLGTFYFLEDYENYLGKINFNLLEGKLRFQGRGGVQRNNLNNLRSVTNTRQIINANLTVAPSRSFSVTGRYANFQTDRSPGLISVNDSLRFARATASYGLSPRLTFGSKDRRSSISASVNYQNLEDLLNQENTGRNIDNFNANLTYGISFKPSQFSISLSLLGNENLIQDRETRRIGGNLRMSKKLLDRQLTLTSSAGYMQNFLNQIADGNSITARLGVRYRVKKSYTASFNINYLNRGGQTAFQEFRGTLKFTYILPRKTTN